MSFDFFFNDNFHGTSNLPDIFNILFDICNSLQVTYMILCDICNILFDICNRLQATYMILCEPQAVWVLILWDFLESKFRVLAIVINCKYYVCWHEHLGRILIVVKLYSLHAFTNPSSHI